MLAAVFNLKGASNMDGISHYEAENIAEAAAARAQREAERNADFELQRAIRDLRNELLAELRSAIREHVGSYHSGDA